MTPVYTATEDELGEVLADKILEPWSESFVVSVRMRRRGSGYLKTKLPELIQLSANVPVLIVTDLDRTECAPVLIEDWFQNRQKPDHMIFRVAVREAEAWLMADHYGFAQFFGVPARHLPARPEELADPKASMLSLVSRYAPRTIRSDVVVRVRTGLRQGLAYNARCREFVRDHWSLGRALPKSNSLERASRRIEELARATATD